MVPNKVCVECSFINSCFRFKVINKKNGKENLAVYQKSLGALFQAKGASDWFKKISLAVRPRKSTIQIWVVTCHQYRISAVVSQMSLILWSCKMLTVFSHYQ